jgi:hypothetical protein
VPTLAPLRGGDFMDIIEEALEALQSLRSSDLPPGALMMVVQLESDLRAILQEEAGQLIIKKGMPTEPPERASELRKRTVRDIEELHKELEKEPKYSTAEFKCLSDFEKCQKRRSKYDILCMLSYFICIGRRLRRLR